MKKKSAIDIARETTREKDGGWAEKAKPDLITHFILLNQSLFYTFVTYCAELWGISYKTNRIYVRKVSLKNYELFIKNQLTHCLLNKRPLNLRDLVDFKVVQIMYSFKNKLQSKGCLKLEMSRVKMKIKKCWAGFSPKISFHQSW